MLRCMRWQHGGLPAGSQATWPACLYQLVYQRSRSWPPSSVGLGPSMQPSQRIARFLIFYTRPYPDSNGNDFLNKSGCLPYKYVKLNIVSRRYIHSTQRCSASFPSAEFPLTEIGLEDSPVFVDPGCSTPHPDQIVARLQLLTISTAFRRCKTFSQHGTAQV
jgi:hypothetical protein